MHGPRSTGIGITAGCIVPDRSCASCKPNLKCVEEHAVRIVRIYGHSLVVPVLRIITGTIWTETVPEGTALRTFHKSPACTAVSTGPRTDLAASGVAAAAVIVTDNGLYLGINVIRVTRCDSNIDSAQLIARVNVNKRRPASGVHRRAGRVGTASYKIA